MGIKHIFWAARQRAGSLGHTERNRTKSRDRVSGSDLEKERSGTFIVAGRSYIDVGEKITRAGYVIDEWDGIAAILSRRA